ncbi:50S ribosomal protein L25 [Desulfolithobacter sp.]
MLQVDMPAAVRSVFGKGENRRLRMAGKTPAVLYAGGKDALALQFDATMLYKTLFWIHGRNAVVTLEIEGDDRDKRHVLVQEIQKDPVSDRVVHVDFLEIELDRPIAFKVPLNYVGVAKGVDLGGDLLVYKNSVMLRGCPLDIPDSIEVDVTPLERGDTGITCGDIEIPENVEMLDDKDKVCATVS